jgi:hypothetical protein
MALDVREMRNIPVGGKIDKLGKESGQRNWPWSDHDLSFLCLHSSAGLKVGPGIPHHGLLLRPVTIALNDGADNWN